ncbi:MAG: ferritin-like domain-containing protein [Solirubrobacterales bacterium]
MYSKSIHVPQPASIEVKGLTRSAFLVRGAIAAGAAYGAAAAGPFTARAFGQDSGDVDILNFALTLEFLEADFYDQAIEKVDLGGDLESLAQEIGDNEQEHVDALTKAIEDLGGTPAKKPTFTFDLSDKASFLELAQTLEDTGVAAYNGAAPKIKSKDILATAGTIVQIEARHAAAIRLENDAEPAPNAFDEGMSQSEVEKAIQPFIQS